jgi:DNA adenine methylase
MLHSIDREELCARAASLGSALPRPFLRWAGSKRSLVGQLIEVLPATFKKYYEPFLGSGSLFFFLQPPQALLTDTCAELIQTFLSVRDGVPVIRRHIRAMKLCEKEFYRIRGNRSNGRMKRAAEFIYLNRGCFNGLYRVNSRGDFNVPYGRPRTTNIIDFKNLRACSAALRGHEVRVRKSDFESAIVNAEAGDLVYFDPPYVTGHNNNGFVDYNEKLFSWSDQQRLAKVAKDLKSRKVNVIVSNANHDGVIKLFQGFKWKIISRSSTLASESEYRRPVSEVILYSTGRD